MKTLKLSAILLILVILSIVAIYSKAEAEEAKEASGVTAPLDKYLTELGRGLEEQRRITAQEQTIQELTRDAAYSLTWNMLNMMLGDFAYDKVTDLCKKDYEASEPDSSTPTSAAQSVDATSVNEDNPNCQNSLTTLTAQSTKRAIANGYEYDVSWTIASCKENIQYVVYIANTVNDRTGLVYSSANRGEIKAETKQFTYATDYSNICIQVSDTSIDNNGYACFPVVLTQT